jgi:hypothetical protein
MRIPAPAGSQHVLAEQIQCQPTVRSDIPAVFPLYYQRRCGRIISGSAAGSFAQTKPTSHRAADDLGQTNPRAFWPNEPKAGRRVTQKSFLPERTEATAGVS